MDRLEQIKNDANLTTKSGKPVWVTHCCELTKRYHGLYLNRDGVWTATSWDENGMWQKFDSSVDINWLT